MLTIMAFTVCVGAHADQGKTVRIIEDNKPAMGSTLKIQVAVFPGEDAEASRQAIDKAFKEADRVENMLSASKEGSEVSRINSQGPGRPTQVSSEIFSLIAWSIQNNQNTRGAFDIAVGPLTDLWREAGNNKRLPSNSQIDEAVGAIGSQYIMLDTATNGLLFAKKGMRIDFGDIAKGYAVSRVVKALKDCGVNNALVGLGGYMYCLGMADDKDMWRVGIPHPKDKNKVFASLRLKDRAICTSACYGNYFVIKGKRYSYMVDPRTGYPVNNGVVSATVVADDPVNAGMMSMVLCVLGNDGLQAADSVGSDALIIMEEKGKLKLGLAGGFKEQYGKARK